MLHASITFAPHRVLAVEEAALVEADEELAVGAVGALRAGHRCGAADVRLAAELGGEIGLVGAPVPLPVGSPPCDMKPSITRWKTTSS